MNNVSSKTQPTAKHFISIMKKIGYDEAMFDEVIKRGNIKCKMRTMKEIERDKVATCLDGSAYLAYLAREAGCDSNIVFYIYVNDKKVWWHASPVIKVEGKWCVIDWPNNIKVTFSADTFKKAVTLDSENYLKEGWDYVKAYKVDYDKVKNGCTAEKFLSAISTEICSVGKLPEVLPKSRTLDMFKKVCKHVSLEDNSQNTKSGFHLFNIGIEEEEDLLGNELLPEKDEDELEESPWRKDPEVVQPEDIAKPDGEKVILSTDFSKETGRHDEVQKEDLFGTEVNDGQLPDLNAKFVKVQNDAIKVIDMKEFMDNIGKSSLMDRDKAVSIESMFGNFFNKTNIPEMYSIAPAKTGYDKAIKHMQKVISVEEQTVVDSANAYVTLAYDNITALAEKMNNEVVPDVLSLLRDTQSYTSKSVRQIFDSRDTLPMLDENDQEVDISILDTERERQFHLPYENDHVEPLNRALNAFNNYLKSKELVHFLTKRLDQGLTPEPYKEPSHLDLNESIDGLYLNYMSYLSTLDMYIIFSYVFSDEFVKSVDSLKYIYTTSSEVYKKISDGTEPFKLDNEALDFSRLNKFIVDNSELIRLTNNKVNYANKVLSDLPQFFSIIEDLVVHLKYIFK